MPLIVDEWNYDRNANVLVERKEESFICASYIPSRIKNMYEAGIDYQLYFSLEDFQANREGVVRNTGIFWFDSEASKYKGGPKSTFNVFKMLAYLGDDMFTISPDPKDEFIGTIAARGKDFITIMLYNYIDPDIVTNFISRNIASLNNSERKNILGIIKSDRLSKIMLGQLDISTLHLSNRTKMLLKKARELNDKAIKFKTNARNIKINIKNLKENYLYQKYVVDSSCGLSCKFAPTEEKEVGASDLYQGVLILNPYSVNLIILRQKPKEPQVATPEVNEQPEAGVSSQGVDASKTPNVTKEANKKE
jgi:hypothetical protein